MSRFVLTAQLQLQAPNNVRQVVNQIQSQLGNGVNVNVNLQNANQTQKNLQNINNQVNNLNKSGQQLGRTFGVAVRRFTAFAVATRAVSLFTNGLGSALEEAIDFQRELVKISQVTGKTTKQLDFLTKKINQLSISLGTSSTELLSTTRILAQAGIQAQDLEVALEALAKTSLAPTFENIEKTAEGAVAILAQFGQGVGALERQLGSINAVAGQFAVESGDLIATVRRTGGVFAAAGGDLEDLLGLFTSIRATTRESAESIATGLRTILTRIQRPKTIEFLKEFGVQLTDLNGKFVGPYEAIRRLSEAFSGLEQGDITFVRVAEELGGFRQIGKVIPLLQQFETAERARQAAIDGGNSLTKDAATAQQALAVQIQKVREEFSALIRGIAETGTFQVLVKTSLNFASALIKIAGAIKPLLPLLATFAAVKITKNIAGFLSGVGAGLRGAGGGGGVRGYATGGLVPGTGDRDTVPAMLTPGEFVIRKSSVKKLGVGTLAAMNQNKYAKGGMARIAEVDKSTAEITDGDTFKATVTPTGEPFNASFRLMGFDAYETGKKGSRVSPAEFERIKKIKQKDEDLQNAVQNATLTGSGGGAGFKIPYNSMVGRTTAKSYADKGTDWLRKVVSGMTSEQLAEAVTEKGGSFGRYGIDLGIPEKSLRTGRYENSKATPQEFATGGRILDIKKAGAAILDPEEEKSYTEKISTEDIKNQFGRAAKAKFARGKDPFSKKFSPTSVSVTTKGLNQETSDKFKQVLNDSIVSGLDYAGAALATDLGVPPVAVDQATKQNFIASLRAAQIGDTFENILSTFNNKGVFDSAVDPNRAFDFPNGLTAPLSDNFSGLPDAFIDAKTSSDAANEENIRGKILRQIQKELIDDGIYNVNPLFKAPKKKFFGGLIQKFARGGEAKENKNAYIFDFDDTLATTEAKGFKDFNNPEFITNAMATRYAKLAKRRATQGDDIHVLTARYGSKGIIQAIQGFMSQNGIPTKSVMAVGGAFPNEREPGKKPGTTRKLGTASKKAKILSKLASLYNSITFLDDNEENLLKASQVKGVTAVEAESEKLFKKYAKGGAAPSDTVPALLTPGEFVINKQAAQRIGYGTLKTMNDHGVTGYAAGGVVRTGRNAYGVRSSSLGSELAIGGAIFVEDANRKIKEFAEGVSENDKKWTEGFENILIGIDTFVGKLFGYETFNPEKEASSTKPEQKKSDPTPSPSPQPQQQQQTKPTGTKILFEGGDTAAIKVAKLDEALTKMGITGDENVTMLKAFEKALKDEKSNLEALEAAYASVGKSREMDSMFESSKGAKPFPLPKPSASNPKPGDAGLGAFAPGGPLPKGKQKSEQELQAIVQKTSRRIAGLGSAGSSALVALSGLQLSAEEAAKTNFAFGNALSQGIATFTSLQTVLETTKGWIESNITEDGEVQEGGSLDGFIKGLEGTGQKLTDFGAKMQEAGKGSKIGGRSALGKVSSKLGGTFNKLGGIASKLGPKLLKGVPVIGQIITAVTSVSSFLKAGFAAQEKYNKAIESGTVAEAQRYAVLKETTGITQAASAIFGDGVAEFEIGVKSFFGGPTLDSIKANAEAAKLAAKANKEQAENSKKAAEVMEDVELGLMTLEDAFTSGDITKNLTNFNNALQAAERAAEANNTNKSTGGGKTLRNLGSFLTLGAIESGDARNDRIDSENEQNIEKATKARESEFNSLLPQFNKLAKQTVASGQGFQDFLKIANKDGNLTDKEIEKLRKNFDNLAVQSKKTAAAIAALDLGLGPAKSAASGLSVTLGNLAATADGSGNALENSLNVIEAAASGATLNPDVLADAFSVATSAANEFVGGVDAQKIKQNITILNTALNNSTQAFDNFKTGLKTDQISGDPGKAAEGLINEFAKTLPKEMQGQFKDMFGDLELTEDDIAAIMEGDYDAVYAKIAEAGGESFREFEAVMKPLVDAQNHMISVTRSRIKAEQDATAATMKNIELQEEAAKMLAEFSDRELTSQEKVGFINERASAMGIDDTSASGLLGQVRGNNLSLSAYAATAGDTISDPMERQARNEGIARAQKSSQDAVTVARERVAVYREEIAIAKKRLEAEKKVAEALLAGDVEGFFEAAGASIASDAFRSGDVATLSQLSGKERSAGFAQLTDEEKRASKPLLESLGMSSELADAAAETSPEIQQLQKEASEYAQVLREAGDGPDKLAQASLRAAEALEKLADRALQDAKREAEVRNQELQQRNEEKEAAKKEAEQAEAQQKAKEKPYEDDLRRRAEERDTMLNFEEGTASYEDQLEKEIADIRESDRRLGIDYTNFTNSGTPEMSAQAAARQRDNSSTQFAGARSVQDGPGLWEGIGDVWSGRIDGGVHYGGGAHTDNYSLFRRKGGTIYASRGMFIPRGTDTVPAMLTPGEFVVNRAAVQRGNNLQILRAMNGGDTAPNGAPAPAAMAKGGSVRYYNQGGDVQQGGAGGMGDFISGFGDAIGKLAGAFGTFAQSVETLSNMKLSVSLAPTSVDVNVMGPMLSELSEQTKEIVLNAVVSEIKLNQLGNLERTA